METLFPQIAIIRRPDSISFQTYIRIKHTDDKWYKLFLSSTVKIPEDLADGQREQFVLKKMTNFYTEIYSCQLLMVVDPEAEFGPDWKRQKVFKLDEDQRSEPERLQAEMDAHVEKSKPKEDGSNTSDIKKSSSDETIT